MSRKPGQKGLLKSSTFIWKNIESGCENEIRSEHVIGMIWL
jgi:hypothetical protein